MNRSRSAWGTLVLSVVLIIPALKAYASARSSPPAAPRGPATSSASVLRLAMPDSSATVDPALVADEENVQLSTLLYSGLVRLDANYRVIPDGASRFTVSPDHRVYTFYLRPNLRFSDGDPVRAQDFRFAITRSLNRALKSPSAPTYLLDIKGANDVLTGKARRVSGLKVVNDRVLQITTRWAVPYFPMELTYPTSFAVDSKRITKLGPADNTLWYRKPVGTGPYRLKSWTPNVRMVLTRNPYYYGPRPSIAKVTVSLAPLTTTGAALYSYINRSLDVVSLPPTETSIARKPGMHETTMLSIAGIYMDSTSKPFDRPDVRRAFTLALPRQKVVTRAFGNLVTPFAGSIPPGQRGYDPRLRPLGLDPGRARAALAKGGYADPKKFPAVTLYYSADQLNPEQTKRIERLATAIVKSWKAVLGISINTRQLTLLTLYSKAQSNSLPLYISGWSADYPDPHDWLSSQWRTGALNNNVRYSNKKFDALVDAADVTWDPARRLRLYNQAQQVLVDDAAWIPLYVPHRLVYIRPTVSNLQLTGYGIIPKNGSWARVRLQAAASPSTRRAG